MLFKKKSDNTEIDMQKLPRHVAIIMDGNGRWAQKRGLPRTAGHSAGSETFRKTADFMAHLGVKYLTIYAFSTENWRRPQDEVQEIMRLLDKYLHEAVSDMREKNIRLRFFGDVSPLSDSLKQLILKANEISEHTSGLCVNVCLNYGGRDEIVKATRELAHECVSGGLAPSDITEEMFGKRLYSQDIPDPDLLIRPGGEKRISNFLLWQTAYSEYYFTDTLWPDMNENELKKAILEYQKRKRRFGGI